MARGDDQGACIANREHMMKSWRTPAAAIVCMIAASGMCADARSPHFPRGIVPPTAGRVATGSTLDRDLRGRGDVNRHDLLFARAEETVEVTI